MRVFFSPNYGFRLKPMERGPTLKIEESTG